MFELILNLVSVLAIIVGGFSKQSLIAYIGFIGIIVSILQSIPHAIRGRRKCIPDRIARYVSAGFLSLIKRVWDIIEECGECGEKIVMAAGRVYRVRSRVRDGVVEASITPL